MLSVLFCPTFKAHLYFIQGDITGLNVSGVWGKSPSCSLWELALLQASEALQKTSFTSIVVLMWLLQVIKTYLRLVISRLKLLSVQFLINSSALCSMRVCVFTWCGAMLRLIVLIVVWQNTGYGRFMCESHKWGSKVKSDSLLISAIIMIHWWGISQFYKLWNKRAEPDLELLHWTQPSSCEWSWSTCLIIFILLPTWFLNLHCFLHLSKKKKKWAF